MSKTQSYEETLHNVSRFPLSWPDGWARTADGGRREARFGKSAGRRVSIAEGVSRLLEEAERVNADHIVISTNVPTRRDGLPGSTEPNIADTGVAIYFTLRGTPCCFACDKWDRVGDNLAAIAAHIKTLRDQIRWGVGTIEQAFRGYTALPEFVWWDILGVKRTATRQETQTAFRSKAREVHPDRHGGDHNEMSDLNRAWSAAQKHFDSMEGK